MLANLGCHLAQGYHLSRALAAEHLEPWLFDQDRELFLADVAAHLEAS